MRPLYIGIDFDGTLVRHEYPYIGGAVEGAIETCHALMAAGHRLILWTMRSGEELAAAEAWCAVAGIALYGINANPDQDWSTSPKAYCNIYIDDAALGCPLLSDGSRSYVNWRAVREMLVFGEVIK